MHRRLVARCQVVAPDYREDIFLLAFLCVVLFALLLLASYGVSGCIDNASMAASRDRDKS